jgi:hypothetical protein
MPVLTEQAVKSAGMNKNGQVCESLFRSGIIGIFRISFTRPAGTNPVSHAVGRERIVIKREVAALFASIDENPSFILTHTAVPAASLRDSALIDASRASDPLRITWRDCRQFEGFPDFGMNVYDMLFDIFKMRANAAHTHFKW